MTVTWVRPLVALVMACGLVGAGTAARAADGDVVVSATNVAFRSDDCFSSHVTATGLDPNEDYDIEVTAPNGAYVTSEYVYNRTHDTFSALVCNGIDPVGTYSVAVDSVVATTFRVSRPGFTVKRSGKRSVRGRLMLDGSGIANRKVHVQVKAYGSWYNVVKAKTHADGRVYVTCKKRQRCPMKVRFDYRGFVHSRAFRVYTGPRNGRAVGTPAPAARGLSTSVG